MNYTRYIDDRFALYVFDLDGTLADSLADLSLAVNTMLARRGLPPIETDIVRRGVGTGARNLLARSFAASARQAGSACPPQIRATGIQNDAGPLTVDERLSAYPAFDSLIGSLQEEYSGVYLSVCTARTRLYPGMKNWLENIAARGGKMAVLSNKPVAASIEILRHLKVERFFDVIAGPETTGVLKPDPAGIAFILQKTGISRDRAIMIGDSTVDVETGRNACIAVCGITGGLGGDAELRASGCDVLIERGKT